MREADEERVRPDDLARIKAAYGSLSAENPQTSILHRLRGSDGRYVLVETSVRLAEQGADDCPRKPSHDPGLEPRSQAEEAAGRLHRLLEEALDVMDDGIAIYDAQDRLIVANEAMRNLIPGHHDFFVPGRGFLEIIENVRGEPRERPDEEVYRQYRRRRIEKFRRADGSPEEYDTTDGRWFLLRDFRLREGGTVSVSTNITDLKRALESAQTATRAKSTFVATVSHEIRTPLNGVMGLAELLLDTRLDDAQKRFATLLRDAAASLAELVNDILDISKIEAGKLLLEHIPMHLQAVVDGAASTLRSEILSKGLALTLQIAPNLPSWILGDPVRLRQILLNLLSNACKFTEAGSIVVRASAVKKRGRRFLRVEVTDTGIGIPRDRQHLLFKDFSQVDLSTTRQHGGTGLGLSICKQLAEAMGGDIGLMSDPGQGSTFWFTIALIEAEAPVEAVPDRSRDKGDAVRAHILVVEDTPMNQLVIEKMLEAAGHTVSLADNGRVALEKVQKQNYDLVLMDMRMPEMDGVSAASAIRRLAPPAGDVPILALTANATESDVARCREAGMNGLLAKPVKRTELYAAVASECRRTGSPAAQGRPVLDETILAELRTIIGKERTAEFIEVFRQRLDGALLAARTDTSDRDALEHQVHNLVGLAGTLGLAELTDAARALSDAMRIEAPDAKALRSPFIRAAERAEAAFAARKEAASGAR